MINEAAVRKFFRGENPLGQRFGSSPETSGQIEIVGVVRDAKYNSVRDDAPATMYVPYMQSPRRRDGVRGSHRRRSAQAQWARYARPSGRSTRTCR